MPSAASLLVEAGALVEIIKFRRDRTKGARLTRPPSRRAPRRRNWKRRGLLTKIAPLAVLGLVIGVAVLFERTPDLEVTGSGELIGRARVIDGDTIQLGAERVRLSGIDAPELQQMCRNASSQSYRCGADAAAALTRFVSEAQPIRCRREGRDDYDRVVGRCTRADGQGLAEFMVGRGHALDWPRFSGGAYARHQTDAKARKLGVWAGSFEEPWTWRRVNP